MAKKDKKRWDDFDPEPVGDDAGGVPEEPETPPAEIEATRHEAWNFSTDRPGHVGKDRQR